MGITLVNESELAVMAVLSQLTPLHWTGAIGPGESKRLSCGRVWFTLSVGAFDAKKQPTRLGTAARLTVIVGSAVLTGPLWMPALAVTAAASGYTSTVSGKANKRRVDAPGSSFKVKGCLKKGVYADDKTYVVRGVHKANGTYELYFEKWTRGDREMHICRRRPQESPQQNDDDEYVEYAQVVVDTRIAEGPPPKNGSSMTSVSPFLAPQSPPSYDDDKKKSIPT